MVPVHVSPHSFECSGFPCKLEIDSRQVILCVTQTSCCISLLCSRLKYISSGQRQNSLVFFSHMHLSHSSLSRNSLYFEWLHLNLRNCLQNVGCQWNFWGPGSWVMPAISMIPAMQLKHLACLTSGFSPSSLQGVLPHRPLPGDTPGPHLKIASDAAVLRNHKLLVHDPGALTPNPEDSPYTQPSTQGVGWKGETRKKKAIDQMWDASGLHGCTHR